MDLPSPVQKIAVLRANSLGDFLFCLPALEALRSAYPKAEIVYLGRAWHKEFLGGRPSPIDRVVTIPTSLGPGDEGESDREELSSFFREMRGENFDIALQIHGGGKHSNPFIQKLGAQLTVGFQAPDAPPLDISFPYINFQNEIVRHLEIVQKIGGRVVTLEPRIALTSQDIQEAQKILGNLPSPFLILNVGANDPRRRWPAENFAMVGDHFASQGFRIVISAGTDEQEHAQAVAECMHGTATNLASMLSLGGLAGLLSLATLIVSNDTGPLHLANALGKPTVGLYWIGNLVNFGSLYRRTHIPLVSWTTRCPECNTPSIMGNLPGQNIERCSHVCSFISDIAVDEVIMSAEKLLSWQDPDLRKKPDS